jgi:hypothetical protein
MTSLQDPVIKHKGGKFPMGEGPETGAQINTIPHKGDVLVKQVS